MITHRINEAGYGVEEVPREVVRTMVYTMENMLRGTEQVEIPVQHVFADGIYMRIILIPKGVKLTGRVHKQNDLQIMFYGDLSIMTEDGIRRFTGHCNFVSKAGVKPFAEAHEDTLWATVHHTHLADLDQIEKELFWEDEVPEVDFKTGQVLQEVLPCQQS